MKKLLLEGGVGGHLNHLYDNVSMTYNKMVSILKKASSGELVGTEKADGYNVYLGYRGGQARAARNKGDMQRGGMTMQDLAAREFKGGEDVRQAYLQSFDAYEAALDSLSEDQKIKIFGPDGEVFYNTEIMGPAAAQLLNYDINVLSIHHGGHKTYNRETDTVDVIDASQNSAYLDRVVDIFEQATADKTFSVQRTAFIQLKALDSDASLNVAISKLQKAGFSSTMTILEFLEEKIRPKIDSALPYFDPKIRQEVVDRILNKEGKKGVTQITKGFPRDQKEIVSQIVKQETRLKKEAMWPIEEAIHEFAVDMLEGMESSYILNNEKELKRLQKETQRAIKQIAEYAGPGEEEAKDVLLKQLEKLKHHSKVNATIEGFVFEEDGVLYKFTGNYAPMNQLLGIFKYGRGKIPPIAKGNRDDEILEIETDDEPTLVQSAIKHVIAIPGGFKPPHKGHLAMFQNAYKMATPKPDKLVIFSGKSPRGGFTLEQTKQLLPLFLDSVSINVPVEIVPVGKLPTGRFYKDTSMNKKKNRAGKEIFTDSPIAAIYGYAMDPNNIPDGSKISIAHSEADPQHGLVASSISRERPEIIAAPLVLKVEPDLKAGRGEKISATDLRVAINADDYERFLDFMPDSMDPDKKNYIWQTIFGKELPESSEFESEADISSTIFEMVESILDEKTKTKESKAHSMEEEELDETSTAGGTAAGDVGDVEGGGPGNRDRKKKKKPSLIREEDPTVDEVLNYLLQDLGAK
tara:strand:+ start:463 stop:2709 length:2247 start_codon:yes stop_codon:yes gene_type:complete